MLLNILDMKVFSVDARKRLAKDYELFSVRHSPKDGSYDALTSYADLTPQMCSCFAVWDKEKHYYITYYLTKKESGVCSLEELEKGFAEMLARTGKNPDYFTKLKQEDITSETSLEPLLNLLISYTLTQIETGLTQEPAGGGAFLNVAGSKRTGTVTALQFRIKKRDGQYVMHVAAKSFTEKAKFSKTDKRIAGRASYVISHNGAVMLHKPWRGRDDRTVYVDCPLRKNQRASYDYFVTVGGKGDTFDAVYNSKCGRLYKFCKDFNELFFEKYGLYLRFRDFEYQSYQNTLKKSGYDPHKAVVEALKDACVCVIGTDHSEGCKRLQKTIVSIINSMPKHKSIEENFLPKQGITVVESEDIQTGCLNIRLVHEKEYYAADMDAYEASDKCAVQHITYETLKDKSQKAIRTIVCSCIKEAAIKRDIISKTISLYRNLDHLQVTFPLSFYLCIKAQKNNGGRMSEYYEYFGMSVDADGKLHLYDFNKPFIDYGEHEKYLDYLRWDNEEAPSDDLRIEYIAVSGSNAAAVRNLGYRPLPDYNYLRDVIGNECDARGKPRTSFKSDEADVPRFYQGLLDVWTLDIDGQPCYVVGERGTGMQSSLAKSPNVRSIEVIEGNVDFMKELLPTMLVEFVRFANLTVRPFFIKYLREYALSKLEQ